MRNLLTKGLQSAQNLVATLVSSIFEAAKVVGEGGEGILAFTHLRGGHLPHRPTSVRLVGAVLAE